MHSAVMNGNMIGPTRNYIKFFRVNLSFRHGSLSNVCLNRGKSVSLMPGDWNGLVLITLDHFFKKLLVFKSVGSLVHILYHFSGGSGLVETCSFERFIIAWELILECFS